MFSGLGNLTGLMKQAKQLQERMGAVEKEMLAKRFDGDAGAGAVTAVVDGKGTLVDIKIQPDAAEDVELLEDLIKAAVTVAADKARQAMRDELAQMTGGLNIPGLTEMLGGQSG